MQEEALFLKHIFPLPYYIPYLELLVIKNVYQVHKMLKRISKGTFFVDGSPFRHFNNTYVYTLSIHKLSSERSVSFIILYTKRNFFFSKKYTIRMLCNHRLFNMIKVFKKINIWNLAQKSHGDALLIALYKLQRACSLIEK